MSSFVYTLLPNGLRQTASETLKHHDGQTVMTQTINYDYDNLERLVSETATDVNGDGYDIDYELDIVGNRTKRIISANGQCMQTDYEYNGRDQLTKETHSEPGVCYWFNDKPVYAYTTGGKITHYRIHGSAEKIGPVKAFMMGLPSEMSHYLLILALVCVPVTFFAPAIMSFLRKQESRKRNGFRVKHGMTKAWRRCLCLLLAYLMMIDPVCLNQLANASAQYNQISTGDWGSGNRTSEYQYDANGSCVSKITKETSTGDILETITYDYNIRNKLIRTSRAFTDWEGDIVETTEYTYNDDGDRIAVGRYRTVNAGQPEGLGGKVFLIDPYNHTGYSQVLLEYDGTYGTTYTIGDDVKSSWPLCPGPHTCYNGGYKAKQDRKVEQIAKNPSQYRLQADNSPA